MYSPPYLLVSKPLTLARPTVLLRTALVQKVLLQVLDGNFYKVVLLLIQCPYPEVQYNCSAILGNLILHCEWWPRLLHRT